MASYRAVTLVDLFVKDERETLVLDEDTSGQDMTIHKRSGASCLSLPILLGIT